MLNDLHIKTEMDLRSEAEDVNKIDALGENVRHIYYDAPMYSTMFREEHGETMRTIFTDLADPANYPVYLHCTYGQDRSGTVCYLLGTLLGMDETDLMKEYMLSGLHHGYVAMDEINAFVRRINEMSGVTTREKVERYLLDVGVTFEQIQSIRNILLEDVQ